MISRHWKGLAKTTEADNYISHLRNETFPSLSHIDGFARARILRRNTDQGTEFLIITEWRSMSAIEQFAGESTNVAVVPVNVQAMMIDYDKQVQHFEILE